MGIDETALGAGASPTVDFAGISALSSRPAGYAVALKCLQVQADAEVADPTLKGEKSVKLHPDARSWYVGALGEIAVGKLLNELGPQWFIRHSVPIGADKKDVDHLVIGPTGVFVINTKHHSGAYVWIGDHVLRVNNANTRHLPTATGDAEDVSRRLSKKVGFAVPVVPVVALLNARAITDKRAPQTRAVAVLDARGLVSWLQSQPSALTPTEVELITLAAEEPQTWHVDPRAADTLRVMQRFERLVARVDASRATATPQSARQASPGKPTRLTRPTPGRSPIDIRGILLLWAGAAMVTVAVLALRALANQPCTSATICILPPLYMAFRPLLAVICVIVLGRCLWGTIVKLVRRTTPAKRR